MRLLVCLRLHDHLWTFLCAWMWMWMPLSSCSHLRQAAERAQNANVQLKKVRRMRADCHYGKN